MDAVVLLTNRNNLFRHPLSILDQFYLVYWCACCPRGVGLLTLVPLYSTGVRTAQPPWPRSLTSSRPNSLRTPRAGSYGETRLSFQFIYLFPSPGPYLCPSLICSVVPLQSHHSFFGLVFTVGVCS